MSNPASVLGVTKEGAFSESSLPLSSHPPSSMRMPIQQHLNNGGRLDLCSDSPVLSLESTTSQNNEANTAANPQPRPSNSTRSHSNSLSHSLKDIPSSGSAPASAQGQYGSHGAVGTPSAYVPTNNNQLRTSNEFEVSAGRSRCGSDSAQRHLAANGSSAGNVSVNVTAQMDTHFHNHGQQGRVGGTDLNNGM